MLPEAKRVTLFSGHYGSGKTNIAVNYALWLRRTGHPAALADIDIVNPYFRSADSRGTLEKAGVTVIGLPFANTNVDLPALPSQVYGLVERRDVYAVLDIGGDDRGATALGRFTPYILEEGDYAFLYVVNFLRPLTRTPEDALTVLREIETAAGMRFTGIVNNTNLGNETTADVIAASAPAVRALEEMSGVPAVFTCCEETLARETSGHDYFQLTLQPKII